LIQVAHQGFDGAVAVTDVIGEDFTRPVDHEQMGYRGNRVVPRDHAAIIIDEIDVPGCGHLLLMRGIFSPVNKLRALKSGATEPTAGPASLVTSVAARQKQGKHAITERSKTFIRAPCVAVAREFHIF